MQTLYIDTYIKMLVKKDTPSLGCYMCPLSYMLHFIIDGYELLCTTRSRVHVDRDYGLILSLTPSPLHVLTHCTHSMWLGVAPMSFSPMI